MSRDKRVNREPMAQVKVNCGAASEIALLGKDLFVNYLNQDFFQAGYSIFYVHKNILALTIIELNK